MLPGRSAYVLSAALEPGVPAQCQVDGDRASGAALDDFPGTPNHVSGSGDPGEIDVGKANVAVLWRRVAHLPARQARSARSRCAPSHSSTWRELAAQR